MFGLFVFFFSLFSIFFYSVHYIYVLLFLESLLLSLFFCLGVSFFINLGLFYLFVFILFIVCMGGFGISLLVSFSRFYGRDFFRSTFIF